MEDETAARDEFIRRIFEDEVRSQCLIILCAGNDLDDALKMDRSLVSEIGIEQHITNIWRHLQTILVSAANLSKILWGSQSPTATESESRKEVRLRREAERKPLRDRFQVTDDSPLKDTNLRNDFEHFDERLERWASEHPDANYVGRNIGPPSAIRVDGEPEGRRFQHFDPQAGIVTFWTHSTDLLAVIAEAARIYNLA